MTVGDLDRIFKAYDVRGVVPDDLDEDIARRIGAAFAEWSGGPSVVIGRDCRLSSPDLAAALADGRGLARRRRHRSRARLHRPPLLRLGLARPARR